MEERAHLSAAMRRKEISDEERKEDGTRQDKQTEKSLEFPRPIIVHSITMRDMRSLLQDRNGSEDFITSRRFQFELRRRIRSSSPLSTLFLFREFSLSSQSSWFPNRCQETEQTNEAAAAALDVAAGGAVVVAALSAVAAVEPAAG